MECLKKSVTRLTKPVEIRNLANLLGMTFKLAKVATDFLTACGTRGDARYGEGVNQMFIKEMIVVMKLDHTKTLTFKEEVPV